MAVKGVEFRLSRGVISNRIFSRLAESEHSKTKLSDCSKLKSR